MVLKIITLDKISKRMSAIGEDKGQRTESWGTTALQVWGREEGPAKETREFL